MDTPATTTVKVLLARAGDRWCALPLPRVKRVVRAVKIYPLPGAGEEIAGLAEVDGDPLVVLSLERLIDAPPGATSDLPVALLVEAGPARECEVVGLMVDEAGEIVPLDDKDVLGPPRGLVRGEARVECCGLVTVLDLDQLGRTV